MNKQSSKSWCARAMLALALPLAACGGGESDDKAKEPPPPVQATATTAIDGALPYADFKYLALRFDAPIRDVTNLHEIRFSGPFGEIQGIPDMTADGMEYYLVADRQPLYPNAQFRFHVPLLRLADGRTMKVTAPAPMLAPVRQVVAAGKSHVCTLRSNGRVYCWGVNVDGQLGLGHGLAIGDQAGEMGQALVPVDLGSNASNDPVRAVQLSSGHNHNCALLETGAVKCWGANLSGQLGRGDALNRVGTQPTHMGNALPAVALGTGRTALFLAVGADRSCALLDNGQLKCWGDNAHGALGIGSAKPFIGHSPNELGDGLAAVNLGSGGMHALHVAVGQTHNCATLITGDVKCWGSNSFGELGLGDTRDRGTVAADMGDALPKVDLGGVALAHRVLAGVNGSCVLLTHIARVKCWGRNHHGQLGLGDTADRGGIAGQMGHALSPVNLQPLNSVRSLAIGTGSVCAIEELPARMFCWGANHLGQLGIDSQQSRGSAPEHMGANLLKVKLPPGKRVVDVAMSLAGGFACARLMDGRLYCWGNNASSVIQPLVSSNTALGDAQGEMDVLLPIDLGLPVQLHAAAHRGLGRDTEGRSLR